VNSPPEPRDHASHRAAGWGLLWSVRECVHSSNQRVSTLGLQSTPHDSRVSALGFWTGSWRLPALWASTYFSFHFLSVLCKFLLVQNPTPTSFISIKSCENTHEHTCYVCWGIQEKPATLETSGLPKFMK
jgi:hypothetical protein